MFNRSMLVACCLLLCGGGAFGQDLDDPTRPSSARAPQRPQPVPAQPAQPPRFAPADFNLSQTYIMGPIRRARINGSWYEVGDRLREGVIQEIDATSVAVATPQRVYVLNTDDVRATFNIIEEPQ